MTLMATTMVSAKTGSPEAHLVAAIIKQAYRDLFLPLKPKCGIAPVDRDQALRFLTDTSGRFAELRNHLCSLIGWDGELLAARIRRMLDGREESPVLPKDTTPAVRKRQAEAVVALRDEWHGLQTVQCNQLHPEETGQLQHPASA